MEPGTDYRADAVPGVLNCGVYQSSGRDGAVAECRDEGHVPEDSGGQGMVTGFPRSGKGDVVTTLRDGRLTEIEKGKPGGQQKRTRQARLPAWFG